PPPRHALLPSSPVPSVASVPGLYRRRPPPQLADARPRALRAEGIAELTTLDAWPAARLKIRDMSVDLRKSVAIVGVGCTRFGELYEQSAEDLLCDAV